MTTSFKKIISVFIGLFLQNVEILIIKVITLRNIMLFNFKCKRYNLFSHVKQKLVFKVSWRYLL